MSQSPEPPVARLAAKVAHELNNPLDAVLRYVSLAQRKAHAGDIAEVERHLADAEFGLRRMVEILRDLMDVGREASIPAPLALPIDQLLAQAMRMVAAQAEEAGVALHSESSPAADVVPRYDLRVTQVLANLLKNAIEASPRGAAVQVRRAMVGKRLEIAIEDAGPGIRNDLFPWLFTPFVTTKAPGGGHGLGLAISRELVAAMGGTLVLQNGRERGCVARVTLPVP